MKKNFWIKIDPFSEKLITAAIESGASAVFVPEKNFEDIKKIAKIEILGKKKGDKILGKDFEIVKIKSKDDEKKVEELKGKIPCIIENIDWTVIPLENLISKTSNLIQTVKNSQEAEIALEIMERGADGIFLDTDSVNEIKKTGEIFQKFLTPKLKLKKAKITSIKPVSMSDRCCIDTTSLLSPGSGMLIGNSSKAFFLVHNENVESKFCAARPFRVNAGAVHAYIFLPENKTKYLCEISSGDEVIVCDFEGNTRKVVVGRNKIERRPMILVEAKIENKKISLVLQNAETIRLTATNGKPISITTLKKGDEVLVFLGNEKGRHFGEEICETISEK